MSHLAELNIQSSVGTFISLWCLIFRDKRNMLSKVSFFRPSKITNFVMVFYGLINYRYAPKCLNDWCHDVVPALRCIRLFCERKLIHSHSNNSNHPFFQPNCKSIMVMPMNVKESDIFSATSWPFFVQISSNIVNFVFLSKMLNFAISFVFRPKRISCVPTYITLAAYFVWGYLLYCMYL